jgi:hypothetical protein
MSLNIIGDILSYYKVVLSYRKDTLTIIALLDSGSLYTFILVDYTKRYKRVLSPPILEDLNIVDLPNGQKIYTKGRLRIPLYIRR